MSKLTVSVFGIVLMLVVSMLFTLGNLFVHLERHQNVADIAALTAADAARGIREGEPCTIAQDLAKAHQMVLESCRQQEAIVEVVISFDFLFHRIGCVAIAGPPV